MNKISTCLKSYILVYVNNNNNNNNNNNSNKNNKCVP